MKKQNPDLPIPDLLNKSFLETDRRLATETKSHSGCTAVVSFLQVQHKVVDGKTKNTGNSQLPYVPMLLCCLTSLIFF